MKILRFLYIYVNTARHKLTKQELTFYNAGKENYWTFVSLFSVIFGGGGGGGGGMARYLRRAHYFRGVATFGSLQYFVSVTNAE